MKHVTDKEIADFMAGPHDAEFYSQKANRIGTERDLMSWEMERRALPQIRRNMEALRKSIGRADIPMEQMTADDLLTLAVNIATLTPYAERRLREQCTKEGHKWGQSSREVADKIVGYDDQNDPISIGVTYYKQTCQRCKETRTATPKEVSPF